MNSYTASLLDQFYLIEKENRSPTTSAAQLDINDRHLAELLLIRAVVSTLGKERIQSSRCDLFSNPNLSLIKLKNTCLSLGNSRALRYRYYAWHNPAIALLLLSEPDDAYFINAGSVLLWLRTGKEPNYADGLGGIGLDIMHIERQLKLLNKFGCFASEGQSLADVNYEEAFAFGCHVAKLFGYPEPTRITFWVSIAH